MRIPGGIDMNRTEIRWMTGVWLAGTLLLTAIGMARAQKADEPDQEIWTSRDSQSSGDRRQGERIENLKAVRVFDVTYGYLRGYVSGCNSRTTVSGLCNSAISRACQSGGYASGFGPVERSEENVSLTCVKANSQGYKVARGILKTPAALEQLSGLAGACKFGTSYPDGVCNSAIHRACTAMGFLSGFGPIEQLKEDLQFVCVTRRAAALVGTTFSALAGYHQGCTGQNPVGGECNAAILRGCRSLGYESGFGPVERSEDYTIVVCLAPKASERDGGEAIGTSDVK